MMKEISTRLNFPEMERNILQYWEKENIFEKLRQRNIGGKKFTFLEGPPTANGLPHLGHALTRAMKDVVL
ncbi:MAG: class I tRNA ligase family protein, partial [Thermoplasmata archaeon]